MCETIVNQVIAECNGPSKNGMFFEAESEVQKPGLNHRKGMPQVKGYFRFFADSKNTSA